MAEVIEKTYLDQSGVEHLVEKFGTREDTKDAATLKSAKAYADGLADNYDAAGTAQTKVDELANGQVATNKTDIAGLKTKVENLESINYVAITNEQIDAMFA